jgi:hypothetical protein
MFLLGTKKRKQKEIMIELKNPIILRANLRNISWVLKELYPLNGVKAYAIA